MLRCHDPHADEMLPFLVEQFATPPIDRLADASSRYHALDDRVRTLLAYAPALPDEHNIRAELRAITGGQAASSSAHVKTAARLGVGID